MHDATYRSESEMKPMESEEGTMLEIYFEAGCALVKHCLYILPLSHTPLQYSMRLHI